MTTSVVCLLLAFTSAAIADGPLSGSTATEARQLRKAAANRPRRIIFNNDGNEPVYECKSPTAKDLLKARTQALVGSQVDTIFYCTWCSGFGVFTHNTKVGQVFDTREGIFQPNLIREMLNRGVDPLRVMVEFGKKHRMEVFWSLRMNDTHDGGLTGYGPVMFRANQLKVAHPEYLLGKPDKRPRYGAWSAVDYGRKEIRELAFRYVEEVCRHFDVDGVELDFFRHPIFFRHNTQGEPCDDADRQQMTELLQRIRALSDNVALQRRRPLLLAVRVPDSVPYCHDIGLDVEHWLANDLVDLLVVSGYFQLNPWDYSVALGRKYGVKVYPSLDESRVRDDDARRRRSSLLAYRARAMNAWQAGADGIYLFNFFNPRSPLWRELGEPESLRQLDKDYFASVRGIGVAAGNALPHQRFINLCTLNPHAPLPLAPGQPTVVKLAVGEKPRADAALTLRLQFKGLKQPADTVVKLNRAVLPHGAVAKDWLEFKPDPGLVQPGANEITITLQENVKAWLTDLQLAVRSKKAIP
jgi:hypothetical protein